MAEQPHKILHLVGADNGSSDHDRFNRWYSDHIFQLMKFPGLRGATRYRRVFPHANMPEYLCLYEFDSLQAFQAYDGGQAFLDAEKDKAAGGVLPRLRLQYERIGRWSR
ncbi:MAG: hypothetical protein E5Y02_00575 [Mesorhizobium sp.]|nr:MAG: hypothetical protein E5Y02_00575 [Mesorhizobium sp.]